MNMTNKLFNKMPGSLWIVVSLYTYTYTYIYIYIYIDSAI